MNSEAKEGNKQEFEKESIEAEKIMGAQEPEEVKENKQENEEAEIEKEEVKEEGEGKSREEDDDDDGNEEEEESAAKGSKSETGEFLSPTSDRPTRERKMVKRFTVHATPKSSTPKHLFIEKGQGTQLKDIPNVAFKLSKRKADENLHLLHTILFGKKTKVHTLKKNIGLFSGFVWVENEEKQRAKLKEKIDKCVKEKLLDFCDVLNIRVSKATVKKEELSAKLLEFLESPCATTDILLADKEMGKKKKSNDPSSKRKSCGSSNVAGGKHAKKHRLDSESEKKRKHSTEEDDDVKSEPSQSEDDQDDDNKVSGAESDEKGNDSENGTDEDQPKAEIVVRTSSSKKSTKKDTGGSGEKSKSVNKKVPAKASNTAGKSTKDSSSSASKKGAGDSESKSKTKALSTKKQKTEDSKMDTSPPAKVKGSSKSSTEVLNTGQGEGKFSKKAKKEPSEEEMQAVVVNILKEVDFNTATLSDILRQLGEHFGLDLMHRKSEVRDIITEAIKNMSDDDEEASKSGDESGKDGSDDDA
ncbi:hypothetical protein ACS0TY_033989 [Phlomoides rotata]